MKLPVGIQLYSVRDEMEKDFEGTIKKIKDMGYQGVEFAGLFGRKGKDVKKFCKSLGLNPISAHVPYEEIMQDMDGVLQEYSDAGCKFIAIPYLVDDKRPGTQGFEATVKDFTEIGKKAKKLGMTLLYHNHDFEFNKVQGKYILDIIYDSISKDYLESEIDTCWVNVGGENPASYVEKYKDRAPLVHLKDFKGRVSDRPVYSLIGIDDEEEKDTEDFEFRPIGYGVQNIPQIIDSAIKAGSQWLIVEQDDTALEKSSLECAKMSIDYLKSL